MRSYSYNPGRVIYGRTVRGHPQFITAVFLSRHSLKTDDFLPLKTAEFYYRQCGSFCANGPLMRSCIREVHACLSQGVYFPPSQFETAFFSTAHSSEDFEKTAHVVTKALEG